MNQLKHAREQNYKGIQQTMLPEVGTQLMKILHPLDGFTTKIHSNINKHIFVRFKYISTLNCLCYLYAQVYEQLVIWQSFK